MYSIKELEDILGYTSDQIRLRLKKLKPILTETVKRGENNKILVTNNGLEILKRAKQLEKKDIALSDVPNYLEDELKKTEEDTSDDLAQAGQNLVEEKDKRIEELKTRIEELKEDKVYWRNQAEELQQKLITGEIDEQQEDEGWVRKFLDWLW